MRKPLLVSAALWTCLFALPLTSRGDTPPDTQAAPQPVSGMSIGVTDPGPPAALWQRADLSPAEQAYVDRAGNTAGWAAVNTAWSDAMTDSVAAAQASAAAEQLGVGGLGDEGVVP